jgi:hypothetical protein
MDWEQVEKELSELLPYSSETRSRPASERPNQQLTARFPDEASILKHITEALQLNDVDSRERHYGFRNEAVSSTRLR